MGDALLPVDQHQGLVQELPFLVCHVRDQQAEKDVQPLDLLRQLREPDAGAVQQLVHRMVHPAYLHHVDTVGTCRGDLDELAAHVGAGPVELMPFQWGNNVDGDALPAHPQRHELHGKGLPRAAGAQDRHVGILIDGAVENIHNNEGTVILIHPQQDAVVVTHLIAGKGIAACRPAGQQVAPAFFIQPPLHGRQGEACQECLFLPEMAGTELHILGGQQFLHLVHLPLQILFTGSGDGNKQVQEIKILIVRQALFQEVPAPDGTVYVVKVRIGIAGVLDPGAVDAQLLPHLLDDLLLGLPGEEHIQVDPVPGVDDQAQPPRRHLHPVTVRGNQEVGIIKAVNADMPAVGKINAARRKELPRRDLIHLALSAVLPVPVNHLPDPFRQGFSRALIPAEQVIEHIHGELILVFRHNDLIPALAQVVGRRMDCTLQECGSLPLIIGASGVPPGLILKDQEKPACDRLVGADLLHEPQVVLLHEPALFVGLPFHFLLHRVHVPPDVRPARQDLELQPDRAHLQVGHKRINDVPLFPCAPQEEIDGHDLHDLDITAVFCINDAACNSGNRQVIRHGIQAGRLLFPYG